MQEHFVCIEPTKGHMQTGTTHPIHVLYFETMTSLAQIGAYVRVVARRLYRDAAKNDLEVTGPVYWIYEGADGNPETVFKLTIALPVTEAPASNLEFGTKWLDTFVHISMQHAGDWNELSTTYGELIGNVFTQNLSLSGQNRELYINMDFENPERNITEVQIGITS